MAYKYVVNHIPKTTANNRRPAQAMSATTITIHNTGNTSSTSQNERDWLTNPTNNRTASYHIVIDEIQAIECLPLTENAWHSGDGSTLTSGNRTSIGIEICESGNYQKTLENAVQLVAKMLKERGWGVDRLRRHFDWSGKICPRLMYDSGKWTGWDDFKKRVQNVLTPVVIVKPTKTIPQVAKERIYAENGVLKRCDGNYKISATDVRHVKFETGKVRYKFVYEKGAKVSGLVKKYGADFGFNAPFFYNGIPLGDTEDNDSVISAAYGKMLKWQEFAVIDGKPIIGQINKSDKQDFLVQGAPLLIENGQLVYNMYSAIQEVNDDIAKSQCQRTFVWIDSVGDLHLGIADGRVLNSDKGLTLQEMALYAKSHDAVWALNFDGGGSTILADQSGGLNQKLNTGANERVVHHAILVFVKDESDSQKGDFELAEKIKVDAYNGDKTKEIDAYLSNGVTWVELRKLSEFFGAAVGWDQSKKRASVKK